MSKLFLFKKIPLEKKNPHKLKEIISNIRNEKSLDKAIKLTFNYVVNNWGGNRLLLLLKFNRLFDTKLNKVLSRRGYMHCIQMNYLIRFILMKAGKLEESNIQIGITESWFLVPHQYLKIACGEKIIYLDPWNYQFGISFGQYGSSFKSLRIMPIKGFAKKLSFLEQLKL